MKVKIVLLGVAQGQEPQEALRLQSLGGKRRHDMQAVDRHFRGRTTVLRLGTPHFGDDGTITYRVERARLDEDTLKAVRCTALRALCQI